MFLVVERILTDLLYSLSTFLSVSLQHPSHIVDEEVGGEGEEGRDGRRDQP